MRAAALLVALLGSACAPNLLSVTSLEKPDKATNDVAALMRTEGFECKIDNTDGGMVGCTKKGSFVGVIVNGKGEAAVVMFFTIIKQPLCGEAAYEDRVDGFNAVATIGKAKCTKDILMLYKVVLATSVGYSRKELPQVLTVWHDSILQNATRRGLLDDKLPAEPPPGTPKGPKPPGGPGKPGEGNTI
ncbi:MAG: hypothetical protein IPJ34_36690 [Myxococcales bacterium]|nr:hypothetical protein [Myxococcales bacterium]